MPYIEDFREFRERMKSPSVRTDRGVFFESGAWSDGGYTHMDPPHDVGLLFQNQLAFIEGQLVLKEKEHKALSDYITNQADFFRQGAGPAPDPRAFDDLEKLQQAVFSLREKLAAKRDEQRKSDPRVAARHEALEYQNDLRRDTIDVNAKLAEFAI